MFIGSFNWDPRSVSINTEMGILIDSPAFTKSMSATLSEVLLAETFAVRLEEDNRISWTETDENKSQTVYHYEPTGSSWDHFMAGIYALLPIGSHL